jgi:hypothetical protein
MSTREKSYYRIAKGGVRIKLSGSSWTLLQLAASYYRTAQSGIAGAALPVIQDVSALTAALPTLESIIERQEARRRPGSGSFTHTIPPALFSDLRELMRFAAEFPGGAFHGPIVNITKSLEHLDDVDVIKLLASLATE